MEPAGRPLQVEGSGREEGSHAGIPEEICVPRGPTGSRDEGSTSVRLAAVTPLLLLRHPRAFVKGTCGRW